MQSITCQFCNFATNSIYVAKIHISLCRQNPNFWKYQDPLSTRRNWIKEPAQIGETSAYKENPNTQSITLRGILNFPPDEAPPKSTQLLGETPNRVSEENTTQTKNLPMEVVEIIDLESDAAEQTNRQPLPVNNNRMIKFTCPYCNFVTNSTSASAIHISVCKLNPNLWKCQKPWTARENSNKQPSILREILHLPLDKPPVKIVRSLEENSTRVTEEPPEKNKFETPAEREMLNNSTHTQNNVAEKPNKDLPTEVVEIIDLESDAEEQTNRLPPPVDDNSMITTNKQPLIVREMLNLPQDEAPTKITQPSGEMLNQEKCVGEENSTRVTDEPPEENRVETPAEREMPKNSLQTKNTVVEKPNESLNREVVERIDLKSDAAEKTNRQPPPVDDNSTIGKSVMCQFCDFTTNSSYAVKIHISLCKFNPYISKCQEPLTAKENSTKEPAQLGETSADKGDSNKQPLIVKEMLNLPQDEAPTKITQSLEETRNQEECVGEENSTRVTDEPPEKNRVGTPSEREMLENSLQTNNTVMEEPHESLNREVAELSDLESGAAETTNRQPPPVDDNNMIGKSVTCQFCDFTTNSSSVLTIHISLCKFNPNVWKCQKPRPTKGNLTGQPLIPGEILNLPLDEAPSKIAQSLEKMMDQEKCADEENWTSVTEELPEENRVGTPAEGGTLKNSTQTENTVEETSNKNLPMEVVEIIDLESDAAEKTNRQPPPVDDDDCMIMEGPTVSVNRVVKIADRMTVDEMELAIKSNTRKVHSVLQVMVCNFCSYNTKSTYKMTKHAWVHSKVKKVRVRYGYDYRTLLYCVRCAVPYTAMKYLQNHLMRCSGQVADTVFLFRVGKVMHCTKCVFDSDDRKLVLEHLLKCGKAQTDSDKDRPKQT